MKNFAKLVETSNGNQVLFYVEPDGDDYFFHQIINFDGMQVDIKLTFNENTPIENETGAYKSLDLVDETRADYVEATLLSMLAIEP